MHYLCSLFRYNETEEQVSAEPERENSFRNRFSEIRISLPDCRKSVFPDFYRFFSRKEILSKAGQMKKWWSLIILSLLTIPGYAQFAVSGGILPAYPIGKQELDSYDGLSGIYVIYGTNGVQIKFTSDSEAGMQWYKFTDRAINAIPVNGVQTGYTTVLSDVEGNCGYFVKQNDRNNYIWIVDYLSCELDLYKLTVDTAQTEADRCDQVQLLVEGDFPDITYHTINGQKKKLDRKMVVSCQTLAWDEQTKSFYQTEQNDTIKSLTSKISVKAPYCNTFFTLSGDRMLEFWKMEKTISTPAEYETVSVCGNAFADQFEREALNEIDRGKPDSEYGGSAPVEITFTGYYNEDVTRFKAWQFSRSEAFDIIEASYNDQTLHYTFSEEGTMYVRFLISNCNGTCEWASDPFKVTVGDFKLEAPNIFTPGTSPGVNDVWKVAYKSVIEFKCWIFNRWGVQMAYLDNPADGWDGKYGGKLVPSGVYYYVIEAKGPDGKEHKFKGDINILRPKH